MIIEYGFSLELARPFIVQSVGSGNQKLLYQLIIALLIVIKSIYMHNFDLLLET